MTASDTATRPNGPVAAALLAAGVGSLVLGILVVLNEVSEEASAFLQFDRSFGLGSGVGPLSGKVALAVVAYAVAWVVLHFALRRREVNFRVAFVVSLVLVGLGFALTFPPVFLAFAAPE